MNIAELLALCFLTDSPHFEALYKHLRVEKPPSSFKACVDDDTDVETDLTHKLYAKESSLVPNVLHHMGPQCQAIIGLAAWHTLMSMFNQAHDIHPHALVIDFNVFIVELINKLSENGRVYWPESNGVEEHKKYEKWVLLETNIKFFLALLRACEYGMREVALRKEKYATFTGLPHRHFTLPYDDPIEFKYPFDYECVASFTEPTKHINLPATIITENKFNGLVKAFLCMAALPDNTWDDLYRKSYDPTWEKLPEYQFLYNAFDAVSDVCCSLTDGKVYSNEGLSQSSFFEQ
jgi:hypothetical protein